MRGKEKTEIGRGPWFIKPSLAQFQYEGRQREAVMVLERAPALDHLPALKTFRCVGVICGGVSIAPLRLRHTIYSKSEVDIDF